LALAAVLPESIGGGIVADWHISALLHSVGDDPPVLAFGQPFREPRRGHADHASQRNGIGVAEGIQAIGQFGVLGGMVCIDDGPERGGLGWAVLSD
jgi:hypothetical protein